MNTNEVLKLALEALEGIHPGNMTPMAEEYWNKAITALREALAEPQEKYQYGTPLLDAMRGKANEALDKMAENARELGLDYEPAQQEPVAWGVDWGKAGDIPCVSIIKRLPGGGIEVIAVEYAPYSYTSPPAQRTWVGLTIEDKKEYIARDFGGSRTDAMDWTEKRLKEKNTCSKQ